MTTEASVITEMPSFLSFATDGTKVLNKEGLKAWAKAQMTAAMGTNAYSAYQVDAAILPLVNTLNSVISVSHWATRSDWPAGSSTALAEANGSREAAVSTAIENLSAAAKKVTQAYLTLTSKRKSDIEALAATMFSGDPELSGLPVPVNRVIDPRFYAVTYVTNWGEESAPSGPSEMVEIDQNDMVEITRQGDVPAARWIESWRLYRSNVGTSDTAFQLVDTIPIGTGVYDDTKKAAELGETLPTLNWLMPPAGLKGVTGMANGVMAGYVDKTIYFCEPYYPYAWPYGPDGTVSYDICLKEKVVGLASFGTSLFVGTEGAPVMISGSDSASMSEIELSGGQSCAGARSLVAVDNGVIYASPDGLCMATHNGVELLTLSLFSREDWQALSPSTMIGAVHDSVYYFLWNSGAASGCFALDFVAKKLTRLDLQGSALYTDSITDTLYIASGTSIHAIFGAATRRTGRFKTGVINIARQQPFAWLQVDSDFVAPVKVRLHGDGNLIGPQGQVIKPTDAGYATTITSTVESVKPVRLPPGRYLEYEVEIETTSRVTKVVLAGNTQELQQS